MERVAWTDERIDDALARIDRGFESLRVEMREMRAELRAEMRGMRTEMGTEMREMRTEMREMRMDLQGQIGAQQRQLTAAGWAIAGALLLQLIAFVVAQH